MGVQSDVEEVLNQTDLYIKKQIKRRRKYRRFSPIYNFEINNLNEPINLCFSGCGFLISYHIGVISCLREKGSHIMNNINRIYGSSGGALIGIGILANFSSLKMMELVLGITYLVNSKSFGICDPSLNIPKLLKSYMNRELPSNIHEICTDKLFINLTEFPSIKSFLISEYKSKEDLIDAIICTSFIPILFGAIPPTFRGKRYIDGGWSDNLPRYRIKYLRQSSIKEELILRREQKYMEDIHGVKSTGERIKNIIISPFSGEGDICPLEKETQTSIRVEIMNMCFGIHFQNVCRVMSAFATPTVKSTIQSSIDGYLDTSRFLLVHQIAKNTKNLESKKSFLENNSASTSFNESFQEVILSDPEPHSQFYDNIEEILTFNPHEIIQKIGPNSDVQLNYFTQFFLDTVYSTITFNLHIFRFISKKTATFAAPLIEQYLNILLSVLSYFIPSRRVRQVFGIWRFATQQFKKS